MVSGPQIRAARALLGISAKELAKISEVGWATVRRFETSEGIPEGRSDTHLKLEAALKSRGVEFLGDPVSSPGVRLLRAELKGDGGR